MEELSGNLDHILITGIEGSHAEIQLLPTITDTVISVAGNISLDISSSASPAMSNHLHINLVGEVGLHLSALSSTPTSLILTGVSTAQVTTAHGTIIHVMESITYTVMVSALTNNRMMLELSNLPSPPVIFTRFLHPNREAWLEQGRVSYLDENGVLRYRIF